MFNEDQCLNRWPHKRNRVDETLIRIYVNLNKFMERVSVIKHKLMIILQN